MSIFQKNESGFGTIELLLTVAVIALLGVVGWLVYKNDHKTKPIATSVSAKQSATAAITTPTTSNTQTANATANWTSYTSHDGSFSVKYPSNWVLAADSSNCPGNQLNVGPDSSASGSCNPSASDSPTSLSEVFIAHTSHICAEYPTEAYSFTETAVTIDGASGKEYVGTPTASTKDAGPAPNNVIEYCLTTSGGSGYEAIYQQYSGQPDASSDFNTMVTKTLTFN
jgi:Tfp pilus assembly protein PilE